MEIKVALEELDLFVGNKSIHGQYSRYKDISVDASAEADLKGTLLVNEYDLSGDLPSTYRVLTKTGDTLEVTAFIYEDYLEYNNETVAIFTDEQIYQESRKILFESSDARTQFSFVGQWVRKDESDPVGPREFSIEKDDDNSYYVIMNDNYYSFKISNDLLELNESGSLGATAIKVSSSAPSTLSYSDDGRGGHFDPIKNMLFVKKSE